MSLTSQIQSPESPFMRFARNAIPDSSAVTAVRDGSHRSAIATKSSHSGKRPDWGLIGTAIDFRLRLAFTHADVVPPSAHRGHTLLTRDHPEGAALLDELAEATAAILAEADSLSGTQIELPESLEIDLVRFCVVSAQLDQLYRAYPFVIEKTPLIDGGSVVAFDQACAQVPWFVIDQIHDQVRRANVALRQLRGNTMHAVAGMSFSGSDLVGGADADLLVDGLLLDFKSTHAATTFGKPDVYQLAGYTLLDFDDAYGIESVGIYWTRHGVKRTFSVPRFFELLGAKASVAELRAQLREELIAYEAQRQLRLAAWKRESERAMDDVEQVSDDTRLSRSVHWLRNRLRR